MKETELRFLSEPKLKDPVAVEGLPGIGLVGKLAADHLLSKLKAKKFCELYSPYFPPQVIIQDDGTVRMVKNEFYYFRDKGRDFVIVVGDFQGLTPDSQYDISGRILDVLEKVGVKRVFTLGGLGTGKIVREPKVYGAATNRKLVSEIEKFGITFKDRGGGGIFGASGLVLGLGELRGIEAVCLMGETVGQVVDAKAAKILLEKLMLVLDLKIDMADLDKRAKKTEKELAKLQELQEEQLKAMQMASVKKESTDEDIMRYIR
ncbi:MAG: proteasome assembly chaperone family protein [Candidatus Altiarchaeota archaeon]|nr:proteasome assembly chaperone family protein [Candidatus Altiarchaeota archaeon]